MVPRIRNLLKAFARLGLSGLALFVVFRQIDGPHMAGILRAAHPGWLMAAMLLYALSKVASSFRLTQYFKASGISLTESQNLRLYWVGMFYNLFLPGGIGGDAYKVWVLHRDFGASTGKTLQAVLLDRISGLFMLVVLALILVWASFPEIPWRVMLPIGALIALVALAAFHFLWARNLVAVLPQTTGYALAVQVIQLLCALTLLKAVGVSDHTGAYLAIFLVSSAVAVLPISIGGVGLRELVFVTASQYFPVTSEVAVAFSLLFFLVTAVNSLPGAFVNLPKPGTGEDAA